VYGNCDIDPAADLDTYDLGGPVPCYLVDTTSKWRYVIAQHVCEDVTGIFHYGIPINNDPVIRWFLRATPTNSQFNTVAWSPSLGIFCAVSGNWNRTVNNTTDTAPVSMISTDGDYWETYPCPNYDWRSVCWSEEKQLFAAVGGTAPSGFAHIMTSPDGKVWTDRGNGGSSQAYNYVIWAKELSKFIAVGENGATAHSTDGISWQRITPGLLATNTWNGVVWSPERSILVAISATHSAVSADGTNWSFELIQPHVGISTTWFRVAWSSDLSLFAAVSVGGPIMVSTNGVAWVSRAQTGPAGTLWRDICWAAGPKCFVAVGSTVGANILISYDGITWTTSPGPGDFGWIAAGSSE
jgi:hypothetical protein